MTVNSSNETETNFECMICLCNPFECLGNGEKWFQCSEGHLSCETCYLVLCGASACCPYCYTRTERIRNRIAENVNPASKARKDLNSSKSSAFSTHQANRPQSSTVTSQQFASYLFLIGVITVQLYDRAKCLETFDRVYQENTSCILTQDISSCPNSKQRLASRRPLI